MFLSQEDLPLAFPIMGASYPFTTPQHRKSSIWILTFSEVLGKPVSPSGLSPKWVLIWEIIPGYVSKGEMKSTKGALLSWLLPWAMGILFH